MRLITCTVCGKTRTEAIATVPCPSAAFTDMPKFTSWAHAGIDYVVSNGLMNGVTATTFQPKGTMSRAMLVTVIYRMAGSPKAGAPGFADVKPASWFAPAVAWAAENGIVGGYPDGTFAPNANVTREQMATIFYRYVKYCGGDVSDSVELSGFADASVVGKSHLTAMKWAVAVGLMNGTKSGNVTNLNPKGEATRQETAAMLMRLHRDILGL